MSLYIVGREKVKVFVMLAPREGYLGLIKVFVIVSNGKSLDSIIGRLTLILSNIQEKIKDWRESEEKKMKFECLLLLRPNLISITKFTGGPERETLTYSPHFFSFLST